MSTVYEQPQADEHWLQCRVDKGMFSDEMAVTYPAEGSTQKSVFVAAATVKPMGAHRGRVLVRVLKRNGNMIAVLPSANGDIVYVQAKDISDE